MARGKRLRNPIVGAGDRHAEEARRGFTLIELLVSLAIVALLVSLLLPGIQAVRVRSRQFECKMNLRSVAFDFSVFADPLLKGTRGMDDDKARLRGNEFWLETFQQSQYRVDEFWDHGEAPFQGAVSDLGVMACPEVSGRIRLDDDLNCRQGAVGPRENVSFAFNLRLDSPEVFRRGRWGIESRPLSDRILSVGGMIPLVFDVDGVEAAHRDIVPHYSAPPIDYDNLPPGAPYSDGRYWIPARRHGGESQVAFVSGEVLSARDIGPDANSAWNWAWSPR